MINVIPEIILKTPLSYSIKFLAQFLVSKFTSPNLKNLLMEHNYFLLINQPLKTNFYEHTFQNWRRNVASNISNRL